MDKMDKTISIMVAFYCDALREEQHIYEAVAPRTALLFVTWICI